MLQLQETWLVSETTCWVVYWSNSRRGNSAMPLGVCAFTCTKPSLPLDPHRSARVWIRPRLIVQHCICTQPLRRKGEGREVCGFHDNYRRGGFQISGCMQTKLCASEVSCQRVRMILCSFWTETQINRSFWMTFKTNDARTCCFLWQQKQELYS